MTGKQKTSISKFISLVLRHNPAAAGITLDSKGWADVSALIEGVNRTRHIAFTLADLHEIVDTCDKQRYAISEDGTKIRANQGHSIRVDVELKQAVPLDTLYHGTTARFLGAIYAEGLTPQGRLHVHLSADKATALRVGKRHGSPVVLAIDAKRMHTNGHVFYLSENGVWLTEHVPAEYLQSEGIEVLNELPNS